LLWSAGLLVAAAAALIVDLPVGCWCLERKCPEFLRELFRGAEVFGQGWGVALIAIAILQIDPARRWAIPRMVTIAVATLAVNLLKMMLVRWRPKHFDFQGPVWSTFGEWLPLGSAGYPGQSLPSGHTATAVALAIALAWLYPRGRWFFACLAVLVACQRMETGAHWPSDVLAGAAVGCLMAVLCLDVGPLAEAFDRWESRWKGPAAGPLTR